MVSAREERVVIIGGGASGTLVAIRLLNALGPAAQVVVVEPRALLGQGIAYGTSCDEHLLNVRAAGMTAFGEEPDHFANWLAVERGTTVEEVRTVFAKRKEYAVYLSSLLEAAIAQSAATFLHVQDFAVSAVASPRIVVQTGSGKSLIADKLVLALGNRRPKLPPALAGLQDKRVVVDPWTFPFEPSASERILLVGAGLTMVDTVLQLRDRGHRGSITAISRHGWTPAVHTLAKPNASYDPGAKRAKHVLRNIREHVQRLEAEGHDWRSAIDSLRPFIQSTWRGMSPPEKRRFTGRLQTLWDIHRHRIAFEIWKQISELKEARELSVEAGHIRRVLPSDTGLIVTYRSKEGQEKDIVVDRMINCTGPNADWVRTPDSLVNSLVACGAVRYDELGYGVVVDDELVAGPNVYAIGPLCRGTLWETTAIPEIRAQAAQIAKHIAAAQLAAV